MKNNRGSYIVNILGGGSMWENKAFYIFQLFLVGSVARN